MTDRDHFAAAALAGLLDKTDAGKDLAAWWPEMACHAAYRWADAMLSVRDSRTADKPNLDAAPAARADADRSRTDKAVIRPGDGTGDTLAKRDTTPPRNGTPADGSVQGEGSVPDSRIANEPVAWALICGDCVDSMFTDRDEAVEWASGIIPPAQIVPLYRHPPATLTDAERLGAANSGDDRRSVGGE